MGRICYLSQGKTVSEPFKSDGPEDFQAWTRDFQKPDLPRGYHLDSECIYGNKGYAEMLKKLSRLAPEHFQITEISQHFYPVKQTALQAQQKAGAVVALDCKINGQPFCCYLPRRNDFARPEFLWLLNLCGAEFTLYGDGGDWFVIWCSAQQSQILKARGWQALDLSPDPEWLECQFQWALLRRHVPKILEMLMSHFTAEHWTPAAWVYRGQYFAQQGNEQKAWENWSQAIQAGLHYPFSEVLDRLLLCE